MLRRSRGTSEIVCDRTSLCQIDPDFEAKNRTVMEFYRIEGILCVQKIKRVPRAELGSKKSGAIKFILKTAFFRDVHTDRSPR